MASGCSTACALGDPLHRLDEPLDLLDVEVLADRVLRADVDLAVGCVAAGHRGGEAAALSPPGLSGSGADRGRRRRAGDRSHVTAACAGVPALPARPRRRELSTSALLCPGGGFIWARCRRGDSSATGRRRATVSGPQADRGCEQGVRRRCRGRAGSDRVRRTVIARVGAADRPGPNPVYLPALRFPSGRPAQSHQMRTRSSGSSHRPSPRAGAEGLVELVEVAHDVRAELRRAVQVDGEELLGLLLRRLVRHTCAQLMEDPLRPGEAVVLGGTASRG